MSDLNVLIFGAGAIGTYIGASLLSSGQNAVFLERPESAERLSAGGLELRAGGQIQRFQHPTVRSSLESALAQGPFDAAVAAVKSYDTDGLASQLKPFKDLLPPVLCLQNGVENEEILGNGLGREKIIAGSITTAVGKPAPGIAVVERLRGIGIANSHPVSLRLVEGFTRAGLQTRLFSSGDSMKWSKMLTNLPGNASSAILSMTPTQIFSDPGLFLMESRMMREALAVMSKLGIRVVNLPGVPVRLLAFLFKSVPPVIGRRLIGRSLGSGRGKKMPSFHIDLYSGNPRSEVEALNGAVARFGDKTGVATPVNRMLSDTLQRLVKKEIPVDSFQYQPAKLLELIK
jgi:2-dehydropantoate 2-reductase